MTDDNDIRPMTIDDVGEALSRIRDAGKESGWSNELEFNSSHVAENIISMILSDDYLTICTEDVGAIMIASISSSWYSPSIQANELIFYAHPEVRRNGRAKKLVAEYVRWAKENKASRINIGVNLGVEPENACALCELLDFKQTGYSFTQSVES